MSSNVAFLFPGQGSQAVGMGLDIYEQSPAAREVFTNVDEALGFPLSAVCFQGPVDSLRATNNAQPAIVTVSLAFLAAFQEALAAQGASPLVPRFTAGHSVGEWSALVASQAISLADAIRMVRERGELMHQEGTICPGGMAAVIALDADTLQAVCLEASAQASANLTADAHPGQGKVIIANYNAPGQVVISGEQSALELAGELAKARGAKRVIPLAVSGAFHSPVMQPAAEKLARLVTELEICEPEVPIISNILATSLNSAQEIQKELAPQIASSVQWIKSIEYLVEQGVDTFIEIGPGQTLSGLVKRIAKGVKTFNISTSEDLNKTVEQIREMGHVQSV